MPTEPATEPSNRDRSRTYPTVSAAMEKRTGVPFDEWITAAKIAGVSWDDLVTEITRHCPKIRKPPSKQLLIWWFPELQRDALRERRLAALRAH